MPFIRVNCPKGALSAQQKADLAPRLVQALIRQEIDPVTEIGTAATVSSSTSSTSRTASGGVPLSEHPDKMFWTVEAFVAASYFSQPRRDEMQRDIAAAFVDILVTTYGARTRRHPNRTGLSHALHVIVIEIPEAAGVRVDRRSTPRRSAN